MFAEVLLVGATYKQQRQGNTGATRSNTPCCNSQRQRGRESATTMVQATVEMEVDASGPAWLARQPLVQWAAQLESYGGGRYVPHHVGAHPSKPCLKERRPGQELLLDDLQLEKLSVGVPKSSVTSHPKAAAAPITGLKRSRMAAFR